MHGKMELLKYVHQANRLLVKYQDWSVMNSFRILESKWNWITKHNYVFQERFVLNLTLEEIEYSGMITHNVKNVQKSTILVMLWDVSILKYLSKNSHNVVNDMIDYIDQKLILLIYVKFKDLCLHLEQISFYWLWEINFWICLGLSKLTKRVRVFVLYLKIPNVMIMWKVRKR